MNIMKCVGTEKKVSWNISCFQTMSAELRPHILESLSGETFMDLLPYFFVLTCHHTVHTIRWLYLSKCYYTSLSDQMLSDGFSPNHRWSIWADWLHSERLFAQWLHFPDPVTTSICIFNIVEMQEICFELYFYFFSCGGPQPLYVFYSLCIHH